MPFTVHCPHCKAKIKAPDAARGRKVPCPKCKAGISVLADAPPRTGYVTDNLLLNERIIYWGKPHWFVFVRPLIVIFLGVAVSIFGGHRFSSLTGVPDAGVFVWMGAVFLLAGCADFCFALIYFFCSEFAVTTTRVIKKTGLIYRNTDELFHDKVDSVAVRQGILGRIFRFGTLIVTVATERTWFPFLADPMEFRKFVQLTQQQ